MGPDDAEHDDAALLIDYSTYEVLEELIGSEELTRKFCEAYGGKRVLIPASPEKGKWLVLAVGAAAAEALCNYYRINDGGQWVLIPKGDRQRYNLADIARLLDEGVSLGDSATTLGIHCRTVSRARQAIYRMRAKSLGKRIGNLRVEGSSVASIASELGMPAFCIKAIIDILDADKKRELDRQRANRRTR